VLSFDPGTLAACRWTSGDDCRLCDRIRLWIWIWNFTDACLRKPIVQSGELWTILCNLLQSGELGHPDWHSNCWSVDLFLWRILLGSDRVHRGKLRRVNHYFCAGEGCWRRMALQGAILMSHCRISCLIRYREEFKECKIKGWLNPGGSEEC
jgi:hypothetical protein